ncbi:hypothetical protein MKEN_00496600 [Mycena kentingensis (nom. inval.)]|nr:hypothetical protein MKEN_00496600 [Mycena kentingensis (nom. inval.)]
MSLTLDDDVIGEILAWCEVSTVLSCAQVSRRFNTIASSKQLWIRLLCRLQNADLIPPKILSDEILDSNDGAALVGEIKRIILGPRSWSSETPNPMRTPSSASALLTPSSAMVLRSPAPVRIRQHARFRVADFSEPDSLALVTKMRLLAGGRYLLVYCYHPNAGGAKVVHLYNTQTGARVEADPFGVEIDPVVSPSVDVLPGEDVAFVASARYINSVQYGAKIQRIDLPTGELEDVWSAVLPVEIISLEWPELTLAGDILVITYGRIGFYARERPKTLVINWRLKQYAFLTVPKTDTQLKIALAPGFIFATFRSASLDTHSLNVYPLESLRWREIDELATYEPSTMDHFFFNTTPIISERFAIAESSSALAVHRNPLSLDCFKILLYISPAESAFSPTLPSRPESPQGFRLLDSIAAVLPISAPPQPVLAPTLFSYHFDPATREWAQRSATPAPALTIAGDEIRELTYSGYASIGSPTCGVVDLRRERERKMRRSGDAPLGLATQMHASSLTPYSSAIASFDENEVEIIEFL